MIICHLNKLMDEKNINRNKLSKATGIRSGTLNNLQTSQMKQIPVDSVEKLCDFFQCGINDLFDFIKDED